MRIRAAVLHEPGRPVVIEEVDLDPPKAGEVLVRVAAAGVCHSDVLLADGELGEGRWPMVLGHEGAGVVEVVGEGVTHVAPDDRVGFCIVPSCRQCAECRKGRFNLCVPAGENGVRGTLLDGTSRLRLADGTTLQHSLMTACFAERVVVMAAGAVPLPPGLPLWQAALLGCAVVTGFGAVHNAGRVVPGESVAVIGCGGVGLQVVAAARLAGAGAGDRRGPRSRKARACPRTRRDTHNRGWLGHDGCARPPARRGRRCTPSRWSGERRRCGSRGTSCDPGGTAVVVGLAPKGVEVPLPAIEFLSDKGIRGSYYGNGDPQADLPRLAELALFGELDLAGVVTHVEPLESVERGARAAARRRGGAHRAHRRRRLAGRAPREGPRDQYRGSGPPV